MRWLQHDNKHKIYQKKSMCIESKPTCYYSGTKMELGFKILSFMPVSY